ncbi:hypothetical protein AFCDBAGC_1959 [Methylobacterium cerastii]|uniref:Uncharacterized protein n=1 Tax=Methylobacterium cerastii TaxID=932741 RepID=A0ABQ4QG78_9HYPH|nr:hypothetical protein [Methylobacterium cerastii]GJD44096.1 hypothetical protein AFCDBAGC_1959 [Methylobacterium cerastii]
MRTRPILKRMDASREFDFLFPCQDARHDFVEVEFTAKVRGAPQELETVLRRLGGRRETDVLRLRPRSSQSWHLDTRPGTALFEATGTVDIPTGQNLLIVTLRVQLNPTRFLAHQPDPTPGTIHLRPPLEALRPNPAVAKALSGQTLDGGDNVLTTPAQVPAFCDRDPWWTGILRTYTDKVRTFLVDRMVPAESRAQLDRAGFGPIRKCEVQFEFFHRDALSWAAAFCGALCAADDASETRTFVGTENARNATVGYLNLTKSIRLKVYAKETQRIRIEIVFSRSSRITQALKRLKASSNAGIVDKLLLLRDEAVKQLRKTWTTIMDVTRDGDANAEMFDFMSKLNSRVPEQNRRTMLSLLGNHRRVTATPAGGLAPEAVCRGLVREGVLIPAGIVTRGPARYALAPSWSAMFDRLLGRSDAVTTLH